MSLPPALPPGSNPMAMFRREALEAHLQDKQGEDLLRVGPLWSWAVVMTVSALVLAALVLSTFGRVEITERGPGIIKPQGGVRTLTVPAPGIVVEVYARTGAQVRAGDPILKVDSPQLRGAALEADKALQAHSIEFSAVARSQAILFDQQITTLRARILQLTREIDSFRRSRERAEIRLKANQELQRQGIIGKLGIQEFEDQFESAQRSLASSEQALKQANDELASLEAQRRHQVWQQSTQAALARAKRQAVEYTLAETLIHAPVEGVVDGVVLHPGDQVQAGSLAAKVIPVGTTLVVTAFLREKDRAFVKVGDHVILELAQYPYSEFGTLRGRILRLGTDLASAAEIQEAFGTTEGRGPGPSFKVDIRLEAPMPAGFSLRPGMILEARFTLRKQRLITLVLDPLRRWLK